jgi:hypothetical protein
MKYMIPHHVCVQIYFIFLVFIFVFMNISVPIDSPTKHTTSSLEPFLEGKIKKSQQRVLDEELVSTLILTKNKRRF